MSQTAAFVARLTDERLFGPGQRALLRTLAGRGLDEDVPGFDLFTGLWWPLRERSQAAPRREVAWLITKLYAAFPHLRPDRDMRPPLARVLGQLDPRAEHRQGRFCRFCGRFDALLQSPLPALEPHLRWALSMVREGVAASTVRGMDWVQLTDDLSVWDRGAQHHRGRDVRDIWAEQYLNSVTRYLKGGNHAN